MENLSEDYNNPYKPLNFNKNMAKTKQLEVKLLFINLETNILSMRDFYKKVGEELGISVKSDIWGELDILEKSPLKSVNKGYDGYFFNAGGELNYNVVQKTIQENPKAKFYVYSTNSKKDEKSRIEKHNKALLIRDTNWAKKFLQEIVTQKTGQ